jgi:two-component system cell cycle sensor histidine kinase/response regulator CckA
MLATQTVHANQVSKKKRMSRVLVVEDSPTQAHQLQNILASEQVDVELAPDAESGLLLVHTVPFDLVIADIGLPGMSGIDLCNQIKNHSNKSDVPVILMTSLSDPMNIIRGLESGADNFIPKPYDANQLLARVHAILDKKANRSKNGLQVGVDVVFQGRTVTINSDKEQILDLLIATFENIVRTNRELQTSKAELASAKRKVDEYARKLEGLVRTTEDKRNRAEQALVESERRYRRLVEFSPDAIFISQANKIVFANNPCLRLVGATSVDQVLGKSVLDFIHPDDHAKVAERVRHLESGRPVPLSEEKIIRLDGRLLDVEISASPFLEDGAPAVQMVCRDISDRKTLEAQYYQSQKMEAVGKLAGGIAHDFNNLLTVILGVSELIMLQLPDGDGMKSLVQDIHKAGERAAHLTRQLLAFSRKAVIEPKILDLNSLVANTEKMLRRLIGEDIAITAKLAPALGKVKADAGQIEQVIMNLTVNARDAMPKGGKITIQTCNVQRDEGYAMLHPHVKAGRYVMLSVSDTGCGMSEEVKARVFEPFFTTKGPGKGTGLGLATVYGIVTQCGGHCEVDTEPGRGSSFNIYLPAVNGPQTSGDSFHDGTDLPRGKETVMLVEDEDEVRNITRLILQALHYTVLEARSGQEAIRLCESHPGPIDLLVTDVVMPEMGGPQVSELVSARRQSIKTLFLSGYTDDAIVHHGILHSKVAFLQKPFTHVSLANKVREVLDQ